MYGERTILFMMRSIASTGRADAFAVCGEGKHHFHRRDDGEPVVRDQQRLLSRCRVFVLKALQKEGHPGA